jgi:acetolactate synthase-1/2/3 large subunit
MRAVDAIMECLKAEGVDVVFGYPGGANLPTYDAFYDAGIHHVLVRHEAGAGHAAEGYAKATGRVGVAFGTSGPGATNLVTPIMDAMMDSVPVVFFTGQVRTELLGTDGFQEADTIGITMPAVKHSFLITDPREIPRTIHEAFHIASTGRPGPVVIDLPMDLSKADINYEPVTDVHLPGYQPRTAGNAKQIRQAARALAAARRPVFYTGGGVISANASEELRALVREGGFPITSTLMGLGAYPAPDPQWLGMLGMHGTRTANYAVDEADLLVAIGARFDDRVTGKLSEFAPRAKFIHIDVDPAEVSKNIPAHIPIVGDARSVLTKLVEEYRALDADRGRLDSWWERIATRCATSRARTTRSSPSRSSRRSTTSPAARRSSPRTSGSTRCGARSSTTTPSRAGGSTPAASGRWASACPRRSACSWASRTASASSSRATARSR